MGLVTIAQLIIQQVQFVALWRYLDINWPEWWRDFLDYVTLVNLDPQDIIGQREIPVITFRVLFIIVAILVPLVITVLILLLFQELHIVLWYTCFVAGTVLLAAGAAGRVLPNAGVEGSRNAADVYMIAGGAAVGVCLLCLLVTWYIRHRREQEDLLEGRTAAVKILEAHDYFRHFHRGRTFIHLLVAFWLILFGIVGVGFIDIHVEQLNGGGTTVNGLITIVSFACIVIGAAVLIFAILNMAECGRRAMDCLRVFAKKNLLTLLILLISSSYVPSMTYCMNIFMCTNYHCPSGTVFHPFSNRPQYSYDHSSATFCDTCAFRSETCGIVNTSKLCPAFDESRNWKNPDISCVDEAAAYFYVAAIISLAVYLVAIPWLYYRMVTMLTEKLQTEVVYPGIENDPDAEVYVNQLAHVGPAAGSLYEPYYYSMRYYNIIMLGHRLFVTTVLVVVAPFSAGAAAITLFVHACACVVLIYFQPFISRVEMWLSSALALCNVMNGGYAVYVWRKTGEIPNYSGAIFIVLNVIIPIIVALVSKVFDFREGQKKLKEAREREPAADGTPAEIPATKTVQAKRNIRHHNRIIEEDMNIVTGDLLSKQFMIMGIFFFLALGVAVLGTLRESSEGYKMGTGRYNRGPEYVIAGYATWDNFTSHCCCLVSQTPSKVFLIEERWVCPHSVINHGRVTRDLNHNSTALRPICSTQFVAGCAVDIIDGKTKLTCSDVVREQHPEVSQKAYDYYW